MKNKLVFISNFKSKSKDLCLAFMLLFFCSNVNYLSATEVPKSDPLLAESKNINIYYSSRDQQQQILLNELQIHLKQHLPEYHWQAVDIVNLSTKQINQKHNAKAACQITIGSNATKQILTQRSSVPIYALDITRVELDKFNRVYQRLNVAITGIYQEQSFLRQLLLAKAVIAHINSSGFNQDNLSPELVVLMAKREQSYLPEFSQTATSQAINLKYKLLQTADTAEKFLAYLTKPNDVLLISSDQQLYNPSNLAGLVVAASQQQLHLIGNRHENTLAGALTSVYTPLKMVAPEAVDDIKQYCFNKNKIMPHYATHFRVSINQYIAKNNSLLLPDNIRLEELIFADEKKTLNKGLDNE